MDTPQIHVHSSKPFFVLRIPTIKNWSVSSHSPTTVRFSPSQDVESRVRFELPPSVNIIYPSRITASDVIVKVKDEGQNAQGVSYRAVYLKGWETPAYHMKLGSSEIYMNDAIGDYAEYGLVGPIVLKYLRDSFEFLNVENLTEKNIIDIIDASKEKLHLDEIRKNTKTSVALNCVRQEDRYVVSIKGYRGGPVFQIFKKDLSVRHHNER